MLKALTLQGKSYAFIDKINNTYKKGGHQLIASSLTFMLR